MTRKLVSSNCTTAQVVAALTKHPDWTADAPDTLTWVQMRAWWAYPYVVIEPTSKIVVADVEPGVSVDIPPRADWSIYRPAKKRKVRELAEFTISDSLNYHLSKSGYCGVDNTVKLDPSKTYRLLLVEVDE